MASIRKRILLPVSLSLSLLFSLITACGTDPLYDLRETRIDPSVTLFQDGFTLPIGSSERIRLDAIINKFGPEIKDYLKVDQEGCYMLCYDGAFSLDDELKSMDIKALTSLKGFSSSESFTVHRNELGLVDPPHGVVDLTVYNLSYDINYTHKASLSGFPTELKKLEEVILDEVYLNMEAVFDNLTYDPDVSFDVDVVINLPSFIVPGTIPVKGTIADNRFALAPVKLEKIVDLEIPEDGTVDVDINISGQISANGEKIDLSLINENINVTINASIQDKDGKLAFSKAKGLFSYDFSQSSTIQLDDLPDALKDDKVCLDLNNPQLSLDITTNLGIPLSGSLEIVPYRNNRPVTENIIKLENVKLPCAASAANVARKRYCLCNDKSAVPEGYEFIKADLSSILRQVPDSIQIRIDANVGGGATSVIEPKAQYTFDIDYGITVPLSFGDDFKLTAEAEIDLSGIQAITSLGEFGISGQVVNETPLSLNVMLDILDEDGNVIPQSMSSSLQIRGKDTSDIDFYIALPDTDKNVSKGRLTVSITAVSGEPVKPSGCLQFINLVAVAPKGITIPELLSEL